MRFSVNIIKLYGNSLRKSFIAEQQKCARQRKYKKQTWILAYKDSWQGWVRLCMEGTIEKDQ